MGHLLQLIFVLLMKELFRFCGDWRKLFLVVVTMATTCVIFETFILPYPLNVWFLSPPLNLSSYKSLDKRQLSKTLPVARFEPLQNEPFSAPASLNSSTEIIQENPALDEIFPEIPRNISRRRSRRGKKNIKNIERKEAKVTLPSTPLRRTVPSKLQRYIWSLPPDEALWYANKEIAVAPSIVDDPDLYAPLFRNISVFKRYMPKSCVILHCLVS